MLSLTKHPRNKQIDVLRQAQHDNLFVMEWQQWFIGMLDYIFPRECLGCGQEGQYLCSACFSKIEILSQAQCLFCAAEAANGVCPACREKTGIDYALAAAPHHDKMAATMLEFLKYRFVEELAARAGKLIDRGIVSRGAENLFVNKTVAPIPLHAERLAERGFNQAALIAESLKIKYQWRVDNNLLKRTKNTKQQAKLSRAERLINAENAFALTAGAKVPETVVLLDDVLTTGATFSAAARVFKAAGAKQVFVLAVCHG